MKKLFSKFLLAFGITTGIAWLYMFEHYSNTGPSKPIDAEGKVIQESNHGHIFYIDEAEARLLWHLMLITAILLPLGGLLSKK